MAISRVGHIILGVSDLNRSAKFYRDVLGLKVTGSASGEFLFLDGGGVTIALRQTDALSTCRDELAFETDDIWSTYRALCAKGASFRVEPRVVSSDGETDLLAADFLDPDSHVLSITGRVRRR